MKLIDTLFGKIYYKKRVKVIKKINTSPNLLIFFQM